MTTIILALGCGAAEARAEALYPDLETLPPRDLRFDRADVSVEGTGELHNVLRFSNTPVNVGRGPLVLTGKISWSTKSGTANQRVFDSGGGHTDRPSGMYYFHAEHQHYHYEDWGRYELWTKSDFDAWEAAGRTGEAPFRTGSKTTSCALDEEFVTTLPGTPAPPGVYAANSCSPDSSGIMTQGLSVGWGDTYDYYRFEQWIDLGQSTLEDGDYILRSIADPLNKIFESPGGDDPKRESQRANEAITPFRVSAGQIVDTSPPTGTLTINDVSAETESTNVTLGVLGRDDVSGVDRVRISNDGTNWATYSYGGRGSSPMKISWSLSDTRYGGSQTTGTRTVYAQFLDRSGKWGPTQTDVIRLAGDGGGGDGGGDTGDTGTSRYAEVVSADRPAAYWRLGEPAGATVAVDRVGATNANYIGSPALGTASLLSSDRDNTSVRLDGVDDHVRAPGSASLTFGSSITIEAFVKPEVIPAAGTFASIASQPGAFALQFNGPRLEFTVIQGGVRKRLQAPVSAIEAGTRAHVVGTYDGTVQKLYVDSLLVASMATAGPVDAGAGLNIGSYNGSSEFLRGVIDEVAVYSSALGGLQVKNHYDAGSTTDAGVASPSALTATTASTSQIDIRWQDNSNNETGFVLQRSRDADFSSSHEIALPAGTTMHRDTGLSAGTMYHYRVKAVTTTESSSYSNTSSAQTAQVAVPVTPPAPPAAPSPAPPAAEPGATPAPPPAAKPRSHLRGLGVSRSQNLRVVMRRGVRMSFITAEPVRVRVAIRVSARDARRLGIRRVVRNARLTLPADRSGRRLRLRSPAVAELRGRRRVNLYVTVRAVGDTTPKTITRKARLTRR